MSRIPENWIMKLHY